jgi:RimJ/RimL family protein N-acetyltransferase
VIELTAQTDVYRRTAEIGYWIAEPFWNKGIATEAVKLITAYGLHQLDFVRIHTGIFEFNPSSMRVLEKCGYKKDGVFEKSVTKNGRLWDEHRYSIINHSIG